MKRFSVVLGLLALLALPLLVAAQYDYPPGGGMQGGGDAATDGNMGGSGGVAIVDFAFQPSATFVGVGESVTWTNTGAAPHTVSADSGAFDSSTISPGGSFSQTFDAAGMYAYHCAIHPNMRGMVVVTGA